MRKSLLCLGISVLFLFYGVSVLGESNVKNAWTIMHYGSTANSAEETIMDDYAEMKKGFIDSQEMEDLMPQ